MASGTVSSFARDASEDGMDGRFFRRKLVVQVSFIQILKAATPAFTLTICALMGLEKPTLPLAASVVMIILGTGLATLIESSGTGFSWFGFSCFTFSACLEAVRVVYIQLLLGSLNYSAVEVLVYLGPPTAALLFGASYVWESDGLLDRGFELVLARPAIYLCAVLMGFVVNMSTAKAIQATSSLTFKVFGCVKNSVLVACGMLLGDKVDVLQLLGYLVSMAGFVLYSRAKKCCKQTKSEARRRRSEID